MGNSPLVDRFLANAESGPEEPFLEGRTRLTRSQAAEAMVEHSVTLSKESKGLPILIQGHNSAEWVLSFLAARLIHRLVIPVSAETSAQDLQELRELIGSFYLRDTDQCQGFTIVSDKHVLISDGFDIGLLTSGTTGSPQCAMRSEASVLSEGERYVTGFGFLPADRILVTSPLSHAYSFGMALGGAIAAGSTINLVPRFMPRKVYKVLCQRGQWVLSVVPSTARMLCQVASGSRTKASSIRKIIVGAGPTTPRLEGQIAEQLSRRPDRNYGSTETGVTIGASVPSIPNDVAGKALPGVDVFVANGGPGCMFVRTADPFLGYLTPSGLDNSRVSPDGWYSTRDISAVDERGWITILGRIGRELRRGGRSIQPIEIEGALRSHPLISDVAVIGIQDAGGEDTVQAHVEMGPGKKPTVAELRRHLLPRVDAYKVPTSWRFYECMPRTSGGKPDVSRLNSWEEPSIDCLSVIMSHRISTALSVAQKLGIIGALRTGCNDAGAIATTTGLDKDGIKVILDVLTAAGVFVLTSTGKYIVPESVDGIALGSFLEFEDILKRTWLSEDSVEQTLRRGVANRAFELDSPSSDFLRAYVQVMSTSETAIQAWRRVQLPEGPVLDLGRPPGAWAAVVRRRSPGRQALTHQLPLGRFPSRIDSLQTRESLAAIFVHNGIRYLGETCGALSLTTLREALCPSGWLIVSDIFADAPSSPSWLRKSLLLDWLTHGNIIWPSGTDLCSALDNAGFSKVDRVPCRSIFELIIAQR